MTLLGSTATLVGKSRGSLIAVLGDAHTHVVDHQNCHPLFSWRLLARLLAPF
jgi:hypothetical protein